MSKLISRTGIGIFLKKELNKFSHENPYPVLRVREIRWN
jgi:hypothetical protein